MNEKNVFLGRFDNIVGASRVKSDSGIQFHWFRWNLHIKPRLSWSPKYRSSTYFELKKLHSVGEESAGETWWVNIQLSSFKNWNLTKVFHFRSYVSNYENLYNQATTDVEQYVGNPLNSFILIKKLTSDWKLVNVDQFL